MATSTAEKKVSQAKSTVKKEASEAKSTVKKGISEATETAKNTAFAGLGVVGKLYDGVQNRVEEVSEEATKKWDEFVNRGEQLKDAANDKVNDVNVSFKYNMKEQRAQFGDLVDAVVAFIKPSKS